MKLLTDHSLDEHANILADYLPNGKVFSGKKIEGTNIRSFLQGVAFLTRNAEEKLNEVSQEYDPRTTTYYLSEWEQFVGIPDDCFDVDVSDSKRREQILTKLVSLNVQTEADFIELADAFGIVMTIDNSTAFNPVFTGLGLVANVPPYDVPFTPSGDGGQLVCWITKLVDALSSPTFVNS